MTYQQVQWAQQQEWFCCAIEVGFNQWIITKKRPERRSAINKVIHYLKKTLHPNNQECIQ